MRLRRLLRIHVISLNYLWHENVEIHADQKGIDMAEITSSSENPPPPTPRWVKVFGVVALVLMALFVILHLAGGGSGGHAH